MKNMAIATSSARLARFNKYLGDINYHSKVDAIQSRRRHNLSVETFLELTNGNAPQPDGRESRLQRLKRLVDGPPKFREILHHIRHNVLPGLADNSYTFNKLLIAEEYPLVAWYWELVLNFLLIPTQAMHPSFRNKERSSVFQAITTKATDLNHLSVCILMYTVNTSGVNLSAEICDLSQAKALGISF